MNKFTTVNKPSIKRFAAAVLIAAVIAACLLVCSACGYIFVSVSSITASYNGSAVEVNGSIDEKDVTVTAKYSNNTSKAVSGFKLSYDFSVAGERLVTVTYSETGKSVSTVFTVDVKEKTPEPPEPVVTLDGITAVYNGQDIEVGCNLNNADITVTAHYSDNTSKSVTNFIVSGFDSATAGEKTVTVTYVEDGVTKTCNISVTVNAPPVTLESITAVYNGGNVKVGGTLNNDDIAVTAFYSDESNNTVTNFTVSGFSSAKAGVCTVTVSYVEEGVTKETTVNITVIDDSQEVITNSNFSVHFLQFENQSSGDCVYIKAGDKDILIDAGSTDGSASTIHNYISNYVTDGKLEYVIATHAHYDHISAFVGTSGTAGIMDRYECETIIRYSQAKTTSQIRQKFEAKCDEQVANGAKLYTALECVNNSNGAQNVYDLTEDGSIKMEILNQRYYSQQSSDENNHSVCVMISQKISETQTNNYLFTGDLEESGETSLVNMNPDLPECVLFKGGHHGSYTASNEVLLSKIKPQYVCICCCAGNVEYLKEAPQDLNHSFPAQEMIDRVAKYTDNVYVTTRGFIKWDESKNKYMNDGYEPMNGNIVFSCLNGEITLNCSNNNLKLKDTQWFKENRICPKEWLDEPE